MSMMNGKEYIESLRGLNLEVYFFGQKIKIIVDEPIREVIDSSREIDTANFLDVIH